MSCFKRNSPHQRNTPLWYWSVISLFLLCISACNKNDQKGTAPLSNRPSTTSTNTSNDQREFDTCLQRAEEAIKGKDYDLALSHANEAIRIVPEGAKAH